MKELQLYHSSVTGCYYIIGERLYRFYSPIPGKWKWSTNHKSALRHIKLRLIGNNFRLK